jgi:hypothetical protein
MSQNLRVALWMPTANPVGGSNVINNIGPPTANKRIPSAFAAMTGGGGGGGGIGEAPIDGEAYVRIDGYWVQLDGGTF